VKRVHCPKETAVAWATRSGEWNDVLKEHLACCEPCRDVAETARWMRAIAGTGEDGAPSDAGLVWWRAQLGEQLSQRRARIEKTRLVIESVKLVSLGIAVIGLAIWAIWNWNAMQEGLARFASDLLPQGLVTGNAASGSLWVIGGAVALIAAVLMYPILAEE
jgi:hypothetical protein